MSMSMKHVVLLIPEDLTSLQLTICVTSAKTTQTMLSPWQIEEDMKQNRSCPVHAVDQTVHTDEEKAIREIVDNVLWQMAADRKSTALKQLQGHMWRAAYASGIIKGE